jgi:hypothetical protein
MQKTTRTTFSTLSAIFQNEKQFVAIFQFFEAHARAVVNQRFI